MWRWLFILTFFLIGCVSSSHEGGYIGETVALASYRTSVRQKWFADDPALRTCITAPTLSANGKTSAITYLVTPGDTSVLCEGSSEWKQSGAFLLYWNNRQWRKDPDDIDGSFDGRKGKT